MQRPTTGSTEEELSRLVVDEVRAFRGGHVCRPVGAAGVLESIDHLARHLHPVALEIQKPRVVVKEADGRHTIMIHRATRVATAAAAVDLWRARHH